MDTSNLNQKKRIFFVGLMLALSGVAAAIFNPILGMGAGVFMIIPVISAAYLFEFRMALLIWLCSLLLTMLVLHWNEYPANDLLVAYGGLAVLCATLAAGLVTVRMRRVQQQLLYELDRRNASDAEINKRNSELEALRRASSQLTTSLNLKLILETILKNAAELVRADDVHVFLYDGNHLTFGAALWENQTHREPFKEPRRDGITYTVVRSGEPLLIPDVNSHPLFENWKWGGAIAAFPLSIGKRVYGVMNIAFEKPHPFDENEERILRLFADQAAAAIQNAQLYEDVRQQAVVMEQEILERTVELSSAKERAETVFNNSFDAILLLKTSGEIDHANAAFQTLFGFVDIPYIQPAANLVPDNDRDRFLNQFSYVMTTQLPTNTEITLQRSDGSHFVADVALAPLPDKTGIVCSIRDISRRKQAEERQRTMIQGLRNVLIVANELITCPDVDSTVRGAIEAARAKLGLERCGIFIEQDDFIQGTFGTDSQGNTTDEHKLRIPKGAKWQERLSQLQPDDAQWIVINDSHTEWDGQNNIDIGKGWVVITRIPFTDGTSGFLFNDTTISKAPLDETQQEVISVYCSLLGKIIERKQVEDSIRRAWHKETELSELKSSIITTISHEFRTPMAIIQSSSQLLKHYSDRMDDARKSDHLNKIETQVRQMIALLENVLTINRAEMGKLTFNPQPCDAATFCQAIIENMQHVTGEGHPIIFSTEGDCSNCMIDEDLLRQIVTHLLTNAVKYSPSGTSIGLDLSCDPDHVVIRVQDHGIGIPKEDLKILFQDFHRASNVGNIPGTGLGLSIVKRAAIAHGGTAVVESSEGEGSTFTVVLRTPRTKTTVLQPQ